jgi:hypothetical protein
MPQARLESVDLDQTPSGAPAAQCAEMAPDSSPSGIVMNPSALRISAGLVALGALAACAGAQTSEDYNASLRTVSASAIGIADPATITVSGESRATAKWTWKASVAGKTYACDADDQMRLPTCVQES